MDIDIDVHSNFDPTKLFNKAVQASIKKDNHLVPHVCGYYFQDIPVDPVTGISAIPYDQAEQFGFQKIDFLHLSILSYFESKEQLREYANRPPNWDLLKSRKIVSCLFQIHKHFDVVNKIEPRSVMELADCVAIIRPGKIKLLNYYLKCKANNNIEIARDKLYKIDEKDKYSYKKGHAIAYALNICIQLNLIEDGKYQFDGR
jgi:hypothetical protein